MQTVSRKSPRIKPPSWRIVNLMSIGTACGTFPTREEAIEQATRKYGKVVGEGPYTILVAESLNL